jgi:succinate dehydrogenase / fumarate reductase flavoprotein subunit
LLTRDHVARCIVREIKEGRGSPHGGVFLDIAWIKERLPNAAEHIKRKLPSMYHQFKELAGIDITGEAMEVGPTTHYVMGGVRVDGDTQMSAVPGLFAAGECAGGLHGANRLGGNSLSDLLVFGKLAGEHAAKFAKENGAAAVNQAQVDETAKWALEPLERQDSGQDGVRNPYQIQKDLQEMMQSMVGIVRTESDLLTAIEKLQELKHRAQGVTAVGNREYNPGWHTALDLRPLLTVSEAVARAAIERKESRGAHFREDHEGKDPEWGKTSLVVRRGADGEMEVRRQEVPEPPEELKAIIEDNK